MDMEWLETTARRVLTWRQYVAFTLYLWHPLRQRDIAALIGVHRSRVEALIAIARQRLSAEWRKREAI